MRSTLDVIKERRSIRKFKPEQIKEEELQAIIEAGLYAPSAINKQSWNFTVIQNKEILDELEIKSPKDKNIENDIKVVEDIDLKKELEKTEKYEEDEQSQIDEELKEIYNLISYVPKNINYIAMKSKCGISNVNQKLIILELKGYIKSLPGNNYVRC